MTNTDKGFGSHSVAGAVSYFESREEATQFYASLQSGWDKGAYCAKVNEAHNLLFSQLYSERDYLTIGEIPLWEKDEEFAAESLALQQWWIDTCKIVANYLASVTEETAQPIETFINSLPKFNH